MANIVDKKRYIQVDLDLNSNKWWEIIRYDNHDVETRYGRVGDPGQSTTKSFGNEPEAKAFFDKKIKEKKSDRKGYTEQLTIETEGVQVVQSKSSGNLAQIAKDQIKSDPVTHKLIEYLVKVNIHQIESSTQIRYNSSTGLFQTPLGVVTKEGIEQARDILDTISAIVNGTFDPGIDDSQFKMYVGRYMRIVPTDVGRTRHTARDLFPSMTEVQKQLGILDALESSLKAMEAKPEDEKDDKKEKQPTLFKARLQHLEEAAEFDRIRKKFHATLNKSHQCAHLSVKDVYHVGINSMDEAFESDSAGNINELWHGTRAGNLLSIIKSGFLMPRSLTTAQITGALFGSGIYFALQSTKSLNYCVSPETRILTKDLNWVAADSLKEGDELLAFDEERKPSGHGRSTTRRWQPSTVLNAGRAVLRCVEVVFDNGDKLVVSDNHQFLFCHVASKVEWIEAKDLKPGHIVPKYVEVWEDDKSYDSGWLSGFFDGEGFAGRYGIGANQLPGPTYEALVTRLQSRKSESWTINRKQFGDSPTHGVWLKGSVSTRLKFLGQIKPKRLVSRYLNRFLLKNTIFQCFEQRRVKEVKDVGWRTVVTLGTSTKTFIAEGYASHNSYGYWGGGKYDDSCFLFLCDVKQGKYYVPSYCQGNLPVGYDSFWAQPGKSGIQNDEIIVFRTSQIRPKYLLHCTPGGK